MLPSGTVLDQEHRRHPEKDEEAEGIGESDEDHPAGERRIHVYPLQQQRDQRSRGDTRQQVDRQRDAEHEAQLGVAEPEAHYKADGERPLPASVYTGDPPATA